MNEVTVIRLLGSVILVHRTADGKLCAGDGNPCTCPGHWRQMNMIKDSGKALAALLLMNATSYTNTYIAVGTGPATQSFVASSSKLNAELTTGGFARVLATTAKRITTTSDDTIRWTTTFTARTNGTTSVTEEGIFHASAANAGYCIVAQTFTAVAMATGDTLDITHDLQFS